MAGKGVLRIGAQCYRAMLLGVARGCFRNVTGIAHAMLLGLLSNIGMGCANNGMLTNWHDSCL